LATEASTTLAARIDDPGLRDSFQRLVLAPL
jgi:hypothetical protein